ncbi:MAG TPA: 2-(1,2-epoxy-1,2-dihydrophenyl)acetyl-CoA isomerase [Polyangiaceae bacterium]|nr:2-(1,2-epoxy-1,2-dihydrophenyl)acetyl-CoA isomerase [Polyangiaceae bacterium]
MNDTILLFDVDDGVATLTLNRPATKNALTRELVAELGDRLEALAEDATIRAIILTGAGGAFCSGADLKAAMADPDARSTVDEALVGYHRIIRAIAAAPQPVVAAVDGPAVGFGCDLALACDMRWLSERAYLQEKFVRIGLMPDGGGTLWLTRALGLGRALEIMLTGRKVEAREALSLGLANDVVPTNELATAVGSLARELAKGPPMAMAAIKRAARAALGGSLEDTLRAEREGQLKNLASADFFEGVQAWMEKREPRFSGR